MSQEHQGQVENILQELGKKIDQLIVDAKDAKDDVRAEVEAKVKVLKSKKEKLEEEFDTFKKDNESKWTEIKSHLSAAADEIKKATEAAFKKKD